MGEQFDPAVDATVCLDTDDQIAASLTAVLLTGDSQLLAEAVRAVAWSRLVNQLAQQMNVSVREMRDMLAGKQAFSLNVLLPLLKEYGVMLVAEPVQCKAPQSAERLLKRA